MVANKQFIGAEGENGYQDHFEIKTRYGYVRAMNQCETKDFLYYIKLH